MAHYEFDVILKDLPEISEDEADALHEAGCNDSTPVSCDGVAWLHFDREADSLEEAIRSAVEQIQTAGMVVAKVELDVAALVSAK